MPEDNSTPCANCSSGLHNYCNSILCGCLMIHNNDSDVMRGFKVLKQQLHPEREQLVRGGWSRPPIRVQATVGKRIENGETTQN